MFKLRHLAGSCSKLRPTRPLTLFFFYYSFFLWWTNLTGIDWKPGGDGPFYNCMCQIAGRRAAWWIEPADRSLSRSGVFERPDGRGGELIFFCVRMWTWCCSLSECLCFPSFFLSWTFSQHQWRNQLLCLLCFVFFIFIKRNIRQNPQWSEGFLETRKLAAEMHPWKGTLTSLPDSMLSQGTNQTQELRGQLVDQCSEEHLCFGFSFSNFVALCDDKQWPSVPMHFEFKELQRVNADVWNTCKFYSHLRNVTKSIYKCIIIYEMGSFSHLFK